MSFSKRQGKHTPQCYTKPLDSLKNWNNRLFWVDERIFPTVMAWRTSAPKDGMPPAASYSSVDVTTLNTRRTPIQKQPEVLLCLVGLSRNYFRGDEVYPTFLYDNDREMDLFNLISAPNPLKVKTGIRPRVAHEVLLLTVTASRVIEMEETSVASESSGTPSALEKSSLDFIDKDPPQTIAKRVGAEGQVQDELSQEIPSVGHATTTEIVPETCLEEEVATMGPLVNKRRKQMRRKRVNDEAEANAPPKVLRKDHVSNPAHSAYGGKSLAAMGLGAGSISSTPSAQGAPTAEKSVSDPDPLSYAKPQPYPEQDIAQSSKGTATEIPTKHVATTEVNVQLSVGSPESEKSTSVPSVVGSPGDFLNQYNINFARQVAMGSQLRLRFEQEVRLLKKAKAQVARRDQRIQVREEEIKKLDLEIKSLKAIEMEVHGLRNQAKNLETLLEAEVDMKKVAEAKNVGLAKELESLRAQFTDLQVRNDKLSEQMSTLQTQVTGKERIKAAFEEFNKYEDDKVEQRCVEMDDRLNKLSVDFDEELYPHMLTAIAGRCWVIGHGMPLAVMKCAESSEIRQAFADVVSAGLAKGMSEGLIYGVKHGKAGRDLADIEAYDPEANSKLVKALQDLKDLKHPMMDQLERLKDAPMELIMASLHLESDIGEDAPQWIRDLRLSSSQLKIPVYPEGLAILLADAATQTEVADKEEEPHPRLQRSISLPHVYNL
ncbi:hypothetical protein Tco_0825857 [Tanacetum coccineum]